MEDSKKFGVELIQKSIKFLYDLGIEGSEIWKDKKISLSEAIGLGDNAYSLVQIVTKLDELQAEALNLDTDEGLQIVEYVGNLIKGATGDEIDIIIDNAITVIKKEIELFHDYVEPIIFVIKEIRERK